MAETESRRCQCQISTNTIFSMTVPTSTVLLLTCMTTQEPTFGPMAFMREPSPLPVEEKKEEDDGAVRSKSARKNQTLPSLAVANYSQMAVSPPFMFETSESITTATTGYESLW